jgi:hypothetical protein
MAKTFLWVVLGALVLLFVASIIADPPDWYGGAYELFR